MIQDCICPCIQPQSDLENEICLLSFPHASMPCLVVAVVGGAFRRPADDQDCTCCHMLVLQADQEGRPNKIANVEV